MKAYNSYTIVDITDSGIAQGFPKYAVTSNISTKPTSWTTLAQATQNFNTPGQIMWRQIQYNSSNTTYEQAIGVYGPKGDSITGDKGQGIEDIEEQYYLSSSDLEPIGGSWQATCPAWESNKYFWTRSKITWINPSDITYTTPVLATGINNANIVANTVQDNIENLQIDGTNLLEYSDELNRWTKESGLTVTVLENEYFEITSSTAGNVRKGIYQIVNVQQNTYYTFSCWYYGNNRDSVPLIGLGDQTMTAYGSLSQGDEPTYMKKTLDTGNYTTIKIYLPIYTQSSAYSCYYHPKLEKGMIATQYGLSVESFYEYVAESTQEVQSTLNEQIKTLSGENDSIRASLDEKERNLNASIDKVIQDTLGRTQAQNTYLKTTSFNQVLGTIFDYKDAEQKLENIGSYFVFGAQGGQPYLDMGKIYDDSSLSANSIRMRLTNEQLIFMRQDKKLAWFDSTSLNVQTIKISYGQIQNSLKIDRLSIVPTQSHGIGFVWS